MKITVPKQWFAQSAKIEGDSEVGAGIPSFLRETTATPANAVSAAPSQLAFGRFVSLMRRHRGLTVEKLAEEASVELAEIINIEEHLEHAPEPRVVYQLAITFEVPPKRMMQLSGLTEARESSLTVEAVRFAARSESSAKLTKDEREALEHFIAVLTTQD